MKQKEEFNFSQREFLVKKLKKLNKERDRFLVAYGAGAISLEILKREQDRIREAIKSVEKDLKIASIHLDQIKEIVRIGIDMASHCYVVYGKTDEKYKRIFNQAIFEKIYFKGHKISGYKYNELLSFLII